MENKKISNQCSSMLIDMTRKFSLRGRLISKTRVIDAKAVGYDPLSASKKLISILDRRLKSERSKKVRRRQHSSIRHLPQ